MIVSDIGDSYRISELCELVSLLVAVPVVAMELNLLDMSIKVEIRSASASCKGPGSVSANSN